MQEIYGIISCDVVNSTSLESKELFKLRQEVYGDLFPDLCEQFPSFWGRVVRGDTIECCIEDPNFSFRLALLIKLWLKNWAILHDASYNMEKAGARYSIGIGPMRLIDKQNDFLDGEAIYIAGRNLDYIKENGLYSVFGMNSTNRDVKALISGNLTLMDVIINSVTQRQCPVLYYKLRKFKETKIAELLSITQAAVNIRAKHADWRLIQETLETLENINFKRYVG